MVEGWKRDRERDDDRELKKIKKLFLLIVCLPFFRSSSSLSLFPSLRHPLSAFLHVKLPSLQQDHCFKGR